MLNLEPQRFTTAAVAFFALIISGEAIPTASPGVSPIYARNTLEARIAAWYCSSGSNGLAYANLQQEKATFDRLFGTATLKAASGQCYVSFCRGNACEC